jgi:TRAP-type C4-dicarboxylate transport system substrate-binding protein
MIRVIFCKFAACASAALFSIFAAPAWSAPEVTLKLHHFLSPKAPAHAKMLVPWAERVERASGGRLKIEIYPAMTLGGKPPQLIRQLRDGVVDIVWVVNGYTPGVFPRTEVFELPFIHTNDAVATNLAMRELFASHLAADYDGIKVLALHVHGGNGFHTVDKPVRAAADLAGLKMRTPTRTGSWILEELGATPIGMPVPELPQALSRKVVDGALIPWEIIPPLKLQELTGYQIEGKDKARFGNTVFQISMNEQSWNKLPLDLQKIIADHSGEDWWREVGELWTGWEAGGLNVALKAGNEHIELPAAEMARFREKLEPVVERWIAEMNAKGIDGRALVDAARAAVARHAGR